MVMVTLILLVWRIGFGVTGLELVGVISMVQVCCPVWCWKPVISYHTQIEGPVHGATTNKNSTTVSLYWYGLAQYVVEFSLGIPTSYVGKLRWQNPWDVQWSCDGRTTGMFDEAVMAKPCDGVVTTVMAGTHKAQVGASRWVRCSHWGWNLSGYVTSKMRLLNNLILIFLAHTSKVCKGAHWYSGYPTFQG
jgi:hypothetical protein